MLGILGKKIGMTQIFKEDGKCIPVTSINAGPCFVVQVKNKEIDGYCSVQIGFADKKAKRTTKALAGHFKRVKLVQKNSSRKSELLMKKNMKLDRKLK